MVVPPLAQVVQDGDEGLAPLREAVLHLGGDLGVLLPVDQLVGLQLLQGGAESLEGDAPDVPLISLNRTTPKSISV